MSAGVSSPTEAREQVVGKPINRVDGRLKVMGAARYSAEFPFENLAHAVLLQSTIAKGRIVNINTTDAENAYGVLCVITHLNAPKLNEFEGGNPLKGKPGEKFVPLQSDQVYYDGQNIGIVVAETLEQAKHAASLVTVTYEEEQPTIEIEQGLSQAYQPSDFFGEELQVQRGDVKTAIAEADVTVEATYTTPIEHHNPMEPSASTAVWDGDCLTIYDATQWVFGTQQVVAYALGIKCENVRIISHFVGGGFGCKGWTWWHSILAAIAARKTGRPVKLVLTRQQTFTSCGHRPRTIQQIVLGAKPNGELTAIQHITTSQTSEVDEHVEPCGLTTRILYASPNLEVKHNLVQVNTGTPTAMRAPGEAPCTFALESAMDELAYALEIDPVQLRLINHADVNPQTGKPWSSKYLKDCYRMGAERFGWSRRNPTPGSMRDGDELIGWGMATATYPGYRSPASAKAQLFADGRAVVSSATHDIGTGTYTVMTQIAADVLGLPVERIEFKLGDSSMPNAPLAGGSQSAASVGPAVAGAAEAVRNRAIELAIGDRTSPLYGVAQADVATANGRVFLKGDSSRGETYAEILQRNNLPALEIEATANTASMETQQEARNPAVRICAGKDENADLQQYAFQSFGAQFVEVRVNPRLGRVRVSRVVSAIDVGRILNYKTARSQIMGGVIFGIGMALMEETVLDPQSGRLVVRNLADYHVPVHADIGKIEVLFADKPDPHISSLGIRGVGEIGITGVAGAIANAIYHATGKRIRDLPITPDKLL
ncbi:xanthine dehydrogenase family protein molybdopterin-binding subunit [Scytonema sp. NUACC26]|uniref:xanthine dehydrogenase family protein molybdopterin-binding subunit n=1 Tax=Scytonema sp. NUACC26 TaxID=3140176 RepID=UPI0034DB9AD4